MFHKLNPFPQGELSPHHLSLSEKLNDTPLVFLFAPALLSPGCLCLNFKGLGLRGLAGSYGCREDSSGFTQGRVSPRGDREMSASVSLCLSSKPCQRRLCWRSITALSLRVSFWLVIWNAQTVQLASQPNSPSPPTPLFSTDTLRDTTNTRSRCLSCFTVWVWV